MSELILETKPKSPISEAYRTIRTNVDFSSIDKDLKVILVTSPGPGEGKSTTAANLAMAYAQAGKRTLFIDCDLRKPSAYRIFKCGNRMGLVNVITQGINLHDMNKLQVEGFRLEEVMTRYNDKLDILTSGKTPPNPSEIIGSNKMKLFLQLAASRYERVIIDSPPVNAVTDAQILATLADGVILVAASEMTHNDAARNALELLRKVQANVIGVVLRRVKVKKDHYSYYSNYYYAENPTPERKGRKR